MSDPRPLTERLTAALTDEVLNDVNLTIAHGFAAYPKVRAVLIAALLPVVEEHNQGYVNSFRRVEECLKSTWNEAQTDDSCSWATHCCAAIRLLKKLDIEDCREQMHQAQADAAFARDAWEQCRQKPPAEGPTPAPGDAQKVVE